MKDHIDIVERKLYNAFKKAYRESHLHEKRNTKYYERLRKLYRDQDKPNLDFWIRNHNHERQAPNVTEFTAISPVSDTGSNM